MSLRDFIRATTQDIQAAGTKKVGRAEPIAVEEMATEAKKSGMPGAEAEETEEETSLVKKPSRKKRCADGEQEGEKRRRRKERSRRAEREVQESEDETSLEIWDEVEVLEWCEEPVAPPVKAADLVGEFLVQLTQTGGPSTQAAPDDEDKPYAPRWNIYPGTQLRLPLERAEWVARALPPAERAVFASAKVFDICDLANRAAVRATISTNRMQELLCTQDMQVKKWKEEVTKLRLSKSRVDRLINDSLRREQNLSRELDPLRERAARTSELEERLGQAEKEIELLKAQGAELEEARKQLAEMEEVKSRLAEKEKQMEEMNAKNMLLTKDLTAVAGELPGSEETQRFLMTTGIGEIVAKC